MGTQPRIKLTKADPLHHEISIQGLLLDNTALEIISRHPESDWPEIISLALTTGLTLFNKVDGPRLKLLERLTHLQSHMAAPAHSNLSAEQVSQLRQHLNKTFQRITEDWERQVAEGIASMLETWRRDP